jgi:hypothetical protein
VLHTEVSSVLLGAFHGALEYVRWVYQLKFIKVRQNVFVLEVGLLGSLFCVIVINFCVNSIFGLIINPLSNEQFVFIVVEI